MTAWVYSRASIFTSGGARSNMLTPFHPFSWKWEESALQFYDLIPLGKISVAPGMSSAQGVENGKKYALCFLPRHFLVFSFCIAVIQKHLRTQIFVCTLKYLCVGVSHPPSPCPLPIKIKQHSLCAALPVILRTSRLHCFSPLRLLSASRTERSAACRVSQQIGGEKKEAGFQVKCQVQFYSESSCVSVMNGLFSEDDG